MKNFHYWGLGFATGFLIACLVAGTIINHHKFDNCEPMSNNAYQIQWYECAK